MKPVLKTNAMRQLDQAHIPYETLYYELDDQPFSGELVAEIMGLNPDICYKTLAAVHGPELFLFVIPVNQNLDLKKAAMAMGVKNLEMVKVSELLKKVGYERGSVSPIGIIKKHRTCMDSSVLTHESVEISGGKKGIGLCVNVTDLIHVTEAEVKDICQ